MTGVWIVSTMWRVLPKQVRHPRGDTFSHHTLSPGNLNLCPMRTCLNVVVLGFRLRAIVLFS